MKTPPPRKLIQVTSSAGWGGRESLPLAIHRLWVDAGLESLLLCGEGTPLAQRAGSEATALPRARTALAASVRRLLRSKDWLPHNAPVLISHFSRDLPSLRWALRGMSDVRLVLVKHVSPGPPKMDLIHRWVYARVDTLLGVSDFVVQKCRTSYPIDSDRVNVWYPGVDVDNFTFSDAARTRVRSLHRAERDHTIFGYVGRITPNKGLEDLLSAFGNLSSDHPDAYLWIVGGASSDESAYEEGLRAWVQERSLGARIVFCGYRENVNEYMSALDVFVTPSREESFGLTTVEAMAASRPVVGFSVAGTGEIVLDGETGILASPSGETDINLRSAMGKILSDPAHASAMGFAGRERAHKLFSHNEMRRRLELLVQA